MPHLFAAHGRVYEIHAGARAIGLASHPALRAAPAPATPLRFADREAARRFLRALAAGDPASLQRLRRAAGAHRVGSDGDVLEDLTSALVTARLRVVARPAPPRAFSPPPPVEIEAPPEAPLAPREIEAPAPEAPPEIAEPAMQAEVLRAAAAAGVPFCEECEKARRKAAA
jgi:hypothetical protein